MQILELYFGFGRILTVWTWIRFLILFLLLFFVIYGMYIISAPKETKRTHRLPGALAASVVLVAASILYSRMISASLKYTLLYGSLASFIILMIWLYTCAIILIMGNVFNISLQKNKTPGLKNI
jgi:membrane protein